MDYSRGDILDILAYNQDQAKELFARAVKTRDSAIGDGIYLRGLIEYSNICRKNCLYCGIRREVQIDRYCLNREQVLDAARFAYENRYGSVVIQAGERNDRGFIEEITGILHDISELSSGELAVTLSLGEQTGETYRKWREAGATRYLLRIESSNAELYGQIHPRDNDHLFDDRLEALAALRAEGYQVGTGIMIGLPFQTPEHIADDLLFMKELDIDMCGMGPYLVSKATPLAKYCDGLLPEQQRLFLTLKCIAILRMMMPDINIAASTALQAIDPGGRLAAIDAGANVVMPNLSPMELRRSYFLYENKPLVMDSRILEKNVRYGEWGDSKHFSLKNHFED